MPGFGDRLCSALTYFTFGIFGIIWLLFAYVIRKKHVSKFVIFNIYQSFFISILFAIIGLAYDTLQKILAIPGFLGDIVNAFDIYLNKTPMYFGFSISGLLVAVFIGYLMFFSILGRKPVVPFVSRIISINIGA